MPIQQNSVSLIMSTHKIRISYVEFYPFVIADCSRFPTFHATSRCQRPGIAIEIFNLLTNYLNLTIEVTAVRTIDSANKKYIYDELDNNRTDTSAMLLANTSIHSKKYDFTKELYPVLFFLHSFKLNVLGFCEIVYKTS